MIRSMMSGISGLKNHQTAMDVIGNNIANVNTTGFKASRVTFCEVFSNTMANATAPSNETGTGGTNPMQIGMGSGMASIDMLYTSGNIERTDNPLDVSIDGTGLFVVKESDLSGYTFTRAGAFGVDKQGNLVTSNGSLVCGWTKKTMSEDALEYDGFDYTMKPEPINVYLDEFNGDKRTIQPKPTTAVEFSGNLNSNSATGDKVNIPMTLYDNYGNEIQANMELIKQENLTTENTVKKEAGNALTQNLVKGTYVKADTEEFTEYTPVITGNYFGVPAGVETVEAQGGLVLGTTTPEGKFVVPANAELIVTDDTDFQGKYLKVERKTVIKEYYPVSPDTKGALKVIDDTKELSINVWTYSLTVNGKPVKDSDNKDITGEIVFGSGEENADDYGKVIELRDNEGKKIDGLNLIADVDYTGDSDNIANVSFDFDTLTQYAAKDSASVYNSNGYPTGKLQEYSIGNDGIITGIYSNGKQQMLGMIALAYFENPTGLKSIGDSSYTQTANSGEFRAVVPGEEGGSLTSNTLEMSNVDLSTEFTNMIVYQRGFQANSRTITTADEMLQELVNLKR